MTLTIIQTLLVSLVTGISWAVVLTSQPYQWFLNFSRLSTFTLFSCALCSGWWVTAYMLLFYIGDTLSVSLLFSGVGAVAAEMTYRQLNTVEI